MMNFNKNNLKELCSMTIKLLILLVMLVSCSDAPQEPAVENIQTVEKAKKINKDHLLKGHQDYIQKAKDMEKEVLKAAERQKKAIEDASQ